MPALQVRDFPADLYGRFKAFAESNHRSIAQQTIETIESALDRGPTSSYRHENTANEDINDSAAESRIRKRKAIARRAEARRNRLGRDIPSPQEMISQARQERDEAFDEIESSIMGISS